MDIKKRQQKQEYPLAPERIKKRVLNENSSFSVAEAYKAARTNLLFTRTGKECQKIVITSTFDSEGKTVNCINLGITLAQNGLRVLLIDADMRRPRIQYVFNIKCQHGLSEALAGMSNGGAKNGAAKNGSTGNGSTGNGSTGNGSTKNGAESSNGMFLIHKTNHENLFVLPAGHTPPNPAELLASPRMELILSALEKKFDYILIDSPPVAVVTDAAVLSRMVNGYLLVVQQGVTPMEALRATVMRMEQLQANIIGFILNNADASSSYYKYGRYGKYGKYGRYGRYGRYGGKYGKYGKRGYGAYQRDPGTYADEAMQIDEPERA